MKKGFKIVAVSDTHSSSSQLQQLINNKVEGDIFIHAGDFTKYGYEQHFVNFIQCLKKLQFRHKIVIAGNHDIALDDLMKPSKKQYLQNKYPCLLSREVILSQIKSCAYYLDNDFIQIEGLKIFGSPYTMKYGKGAFQYAKIDDQIAWNFLPQQIDILITHGPPYKVLDKTSHQVNAGSKGLLKAVKKIKPKIHIFGHIHQGHGKLNQFGVRFYNVAKKYQTIDIQ